MLLSEALAKLCLYKIRQLKILQRGGDIQTLTRSLDREQQLVQSIVTPETLDDFDRVLYNTYRLLEHRLMEGLEKDKQQTAAILAELQVSRTLDKNYLP